VIGGGAGRERQQLNRVPPRAGVEKALTEAMSNGCSPRARNGHRSSADLD
jgi:hypothetical protein